MLRTREGEVDEEYENERQQLLSIATQSIASGCTTEALEHGFNAGYAGTMLRQSINDTDQQTRATLLMMLAARNDGNDEETIRVANLLKRYGAKINQPDTIIHSSPLNVAADFGRTRLLQWLVDQGAFIDHHPSISPTVPVFYTCQNNHPQCTGILVKAALEQDKVAGTLNKEAKSGITPANKCMERGHLECMGALAMGGADLRRAFATYWVTSGYATDEVAPNSDPDPAIQPQASLLQTLLSFTTLQCAHCQTFSTTYLQQCSRCRMAHYCSRDCQLEDWKFHKHCCKKLRKGQDLVEKTSDDHLPQPSNEPLAFTPFAGRDFVSGNRSRDVPSIVWEYNAGSRGSPDWRRYPIHIEESLESLLQAGSPRYMYRPGNTHAEGKEESEKSAKAPPYVASNYVYYCDMLERDYYTGAIRAVRRNESRASPVRGSGGVNPT